MKLLEQSRRNLYCLIHCNAKEGTLDTACLKKSLKRPLFTFCLCTNIYFRFKQDSGNGSQLNISNPVPDILRLKLQTTPGCSMIKKQCIFESKNNILLKSNIEINATFKNVLDGKPTHYQFRSPPNLIFLACIHFSLLKTQLIYL